MERCAFPIWSRPKAALMLSLTRAGCKSGAASRSRVRCFSAFVLRLVAKCTNVFTPGTLNFSRVFHSLRHKASENRDFYPTAPLHGGYVAM